MFFKELANKINLLKEATEDENSIENLEERLKKLRSKEKRLQNAILKQKDKIAKTQSHKLDLKKKSDALINEEQLLLKGLEEKKSELFALQKEWDLVSKTEQKLIKYFSTIS